MSFNLQSSHPPLSFSPYGLPSSLSKTSTVGGGGGGGGEAADCHLRRTTPSLPPKHGDVGSSGHLGGSPAQRSRTEPWPCDEDGEWNGKGSSRVKGPTAINNTINSLSVGGVRMKKVKAKRKVREPRFCFKTMSEVDVLDDGYKWRKYGQKVVKNTQHPSLHLLLLGLGNANLAYDLHLDVNLNQQSIDAVKGIGNITEQKKRSYYRCTQENCRVKKRIERLPEDPRMVITTYEGRHVHSPSHDEESSSQASSKVTVFW
ncbi:WRKY DNA -binding domain [Musa troglodytarum]|uniref:WRKY DNA -binding domain n=1 Tax=Musa troglodytarum TaxID=320322 RepID=A0A9E7G1X6_9LILI|nr:WRKY DNA -binding domain [Musa troglodytarum]